MVYVIAISVDGTERRKRTVALLHVIAGILLIVKSLDYYRLEQYTGFIRVVPFLAVAALSLFYGFARKRVDFYGRQSGKLRLVQAVTFTVLGGVTLPVGSSLDAFGSFTWAGLSLLLYFTERRVYDDLNLELTEGGIRIPGFYRTHIILWEELSNVVIRPDFITLFHKENKYLQFAVGQSLSDLEVMKLNEFAGRKLQEAREGSKKEHEGPGQESSIIKS